MTQPPCHDIGPSGLYGVPVLSAPSVPSAPIRARHNRTWMSRQDLHVTVQSCCERTFVSRYCLYVMTGPSCHDTSIVLRQDLHVTIQSLYDKTFVPQHLPYVATRPPCHDRSAGPGQQQRRGDSNPVPQGVPPPAPFAFFWPFLCGPKEKSKT